MILFYKSLVLIPEINIESILNKITRHAPQVTAFNNNTFMRDAPKYGVWCIRCTPNNVPIFLNEPLLTLSQVVMFKESCLESYQLVNISERCKKIKFRQHCYCFYM